MKNVFKAIAATGIFWALIFFGPYLIVLLNALSFAGMDIITLLASVLFQPVACFMAYSFCKEYYKKEDTVLYLVNLIIACCGFIFVAIAHYVQGGLLIAEGLSNIISVVVLIKLAWGEKKIITGQKSESKTTI